MMWAFSLLVAVAITAAGQTGLVLYSSGLAMVEEVRRITVAEEGLLALCGFPGDTLWETLMIEGLEVVSLRPLPRESWGLAKLVGQEVTVQTKTGAFRGVLRAIIPEGLVLETDAGVVVVREYEWLRGTQYQPIPETQVVVRYLAAAPGEKALRFRYLARGLAWTISYDAEFFGGGLRISGKASINNDTGLDFPATKIALVAGEVRLPRVETKARVLTMAPAPVEAFEYYRYDLPGFWEVPQGLLAIPLVETNVPARKLYRLSGQGVEVRVRFTADTVLPGGEMRVYAEGILVGTSNISHTPQGKEVELFVGTAFDLSGERVQLRRERLGEDLFRESWRITLRSAKKEDVGVEVIENLYGYWRILSSTLPYEVLDAQRIKFVVPVPGGSEALLEYTVEWRS